MLKFMAFYSDGSIMETNIPQPAWGSWSRFFKLAKIAIWKDYADLYIGTSWEDKKFIRRIGDE